MFKKILIANRGEIAIRVMRACKELGIKTAAVYSDADKNSAHTQFADEAIHIGAASPKESYLNADVLIRAALSSKANAIHPGYGFLSENASFALAVESAKLTFIGPSADSIRAMGDKAESKIAMKKAGVPTVPGAEGLESFSEFERAAQKIGYPILVKASAGGGGKGMRIVWDANDLPEEIDSARREALHAFGDERLLIEKYIADAHHIEFQVFGDKHGHLVHLFERECSVQRRHQKIIEETPSPLLSQQLRKDMGEAAVRAAKAVNYDNAGTIEFIFNPSDSTFYFLEMNTRLQVEHPVTELTTGLDLVQWQIRVAAGEHFPYQQEQLTQRGHAIECRIYAEDPANGFLPSTGVLLQFIEPRGPGIRVDSGFRAGDTVTHFYDPMLAKLIVHAETRETAAKKMQAALREFVVHGVVTNIDFLQDVLAHPDFANGKVSTRWVETNFNWTPSSKPSFESLIAASLSDIVMPGSKSQVASSSEFDPYNPWKNPSGFRN
ncbi:MAG TPA: acetyl-CoA carboxylase biotin carboxylase subunit [Anaerolineales bacterium]|nr:acetyl-CoA carboxylase biotin carboxylase subunit [Anaerolineales bacterium]